MVIQNRGKIVFGKISRKRTEKLNVIAALCDNYSIYTNNMNAALFNLGVVLK